MERKNIKIISLGGSVMCPDGLDIEYIKALRAFILDFVKGGYKFVIVTGGGKIAREYQRAGEEIINISNEDKDWIGIAATKLNAEFLRVALGDVADPKIISGPGEIESMSYPITISSGWTPGWSTDYDAVHMARELDVKEVINASKPDYVYDKNLDKYSDAKPIEKMTWGEYREMFPKEWTPGFNAPVDPIAAKLADESGISMLVINGRNLENFKKAIEGETFIGTRII